jgi:hypothetical protein
MKLSHEVSGALRTFSYFLASGTHHLLEGVPYLQLYGDQPSAKASDYRGMINTRPSRRMSLFRPLAALILSTEVPYFFAMPQRVSLPETVCFRLAAGLGLGFDLGGLDLGLLDLEVVREGGFEIRDGVRLWEEPPL